MSLKITTLIENQQGENLSLEYEHGLSVFIENDNTKLLFDTGQSEKFIRNADKLNIDLKTLNYVVLSHGHYDHSGGFKYLADNIGNSFKLIINSRFSYPKYGFNGLSYEYLGNNFQPGFINEKNIEINYADKDINYIKPGIFTVSNFDRIFDCEKLNKRFYLKVNEEYVLDRFSDEIAICIETQKGLIVLVGCSHPGLMNILETISKRTGKKIYGVMGGSHLVEADEGRLDSTIKYLKNKDIQLIGLSHCTGSDAVLKLQSEFKGRFFYNSTGKSVII